MHTTTIRTPFIVNFFFLVPIVIGALCFVLAYETTHASSKCTREFYDNRFQQSEPGMAIECKSRWDYLTFHEVRKMANYQKHYQK